jgi:hypothetical protein
MVEQPYRYNPEEIIESDDKENAGRIKDKHVAEAMMWAENDFRKLQVDKGSMPNRLGVVDNSELQRKADAAADLAARKEIRLQAKKSYEGMGYGPEAASIVAGKEAAKFKGYESLRSGVVDKQLAELREKIKTVPEETAETEKVFRLEDMVGTEGESILVVSDKELAKKMREINAKHKTSGFGFALKSFLKKTIIDRASNPRQEEESKRKAEIHQIVEDTVRERAIKSYTDAGYMPETAKKMAEEQLVKLRELPKKKREFAQKQAEEKAAEVKRQTEELTKIVSESPEETEERSKAEERAKIEEKVTELWKDYFNGKTQKDDTDKLYVELLSNYREQGGDTAILEAKVTKLMDELEKDLDKEKPKEAKEETAEPKKTEEEPKKSEPGEKESKAEEQEEKPEKQAEQLNYEQRIDRIPLAFRPRPGIKLNEEELQTLEYLTNVNEEENTKKKAE